MKQSGYMTRALKSRDPRYARILGKLGYDRRDLTAQQRVEGTSDVTPDELPALRAEYQEVVGKRPFNGWDAAVLRQKIAEAKGA